MPSSSRIRTALPCVVASLAASTALAAHLTIDDSVEGRSTVSHCERIVVELTAVTTAGDAVSGTDVIRIQLRGH